MGTPTKKRTSGQRKRRASHFALKLGALARCSKCKREIPPHRACPHCGTYRDRQAIKIRASQRKKTKAAA